MLSDMQLSVTVLRFCYLLTRQCPTIMESSTKNPLLADLKNRAQSYLNVCRFDLFRRVAHW